LRKNTAFNLQHSVEAMAMQNFANDMQQIEASRAAKLQLVAAMLDKQMAKIASGPEAQAKLAELQAKLYDQYAQKKMAVATHEADQYTETIRTHSGGAGAAPAQGELGEVARALGLKPSQVLEQMNKLAQRIPPEALSIYSGLDQLERFLDAHPDAPGLGKFEGWFAEHAPKALVPEKMLEGQAAMAAVRVPTSHKFFGSSLTKGEVGALDRLISSGAPLPVIKKQIESIRASADADFKRAAGGTHPLIVQMYLNSAKASPDIGQGLVGGNSASRAKDIARGYMEKKQTINFKPKQ
jgi:hypothetical protein